MKLLSDEPAERLQRLLAARFRDHLPELLQGDQFQRRLRPAKKTPSWLDRMAFLLEPSYDNLEANLRASKERKVIIAETRRWVDTGQICMRYVCSFCNLRKSNHVEVRDSETGRLVPLFSPRLHRWRDHFRWRDYRIEPLTSIGRATAAALDFNHPRRIRIRQAEEKFALFPI